MLRKTDGSDRAVMATGRIVALDRARTFITLLVLIHHSVVNYTHFGNGDKMRWLGFDLVVLFNDSFFMACMFLISGLFVHDSLARRGAADFLRDRAWRLGIPFLVSIFVLMPIAYYPTFLRYHLPGTTDFNFFHFWWRTLTVRALALGAGMVSVGAAGVRYRRRRVAGAGAADAESVRPADLFPARPADGRPLRRSWRSRSCLSADAADLRRWQLAGAGRLSAADPDQPDSALCRLFPYRRRHRRGQPSGRNPQRGWRVGEALAALARLCALFYGAILLLVYAHHNWIADFDSPPLLWQSRLWPRLCAVQRRDGVHGAGGVAAPRATSMGLLDAMRPSAYGIFLMHYIFIIWLQYAVYDPCLAGRRQVRHRFRRHAGAELGADGAVAENSACGADDLERHPCI